MRCKGSTNLHGASLARDGHQLPWAWLRGHSQGRCTELPGDPEARVIECKVQVSSILVSLRDRPKLPNHIPTGHIIDSSQKPSLEPALPVELIHHFTLAKGPLQKLAILGGKVRGDRGSLRVLVVELERSRERDTRGRPVVAGGFTQGVRGRGTPRGVG